jgi:UDP-perosamine 4-acetyltransferase
VIGLGAGGHAKAVLDTLEAVGGFDVIGLLDVRSELWGSSVFGVPVLGGDELLDEYRDRSRHVFIGLGIADDSEPRRRLWDVARSHGYEVVSAVHPAAVVSPSARIGAGETLFATCVVGADAELGEDVIVNSGAIVEHDCRVSDHAHIAVGAVLASGVDVGEGAHVGAGATVLQGISIGARSVVGAGSVVVRDVEAGSVVAGVPARILREAGT